MADPGASAVDDDAPPPMPSLRALLGAEPTTLKEFAAEIQPWTSEDLRPPASPPMTLSATYTLLSHIQNGRRPTYRIARAMVMARPGWGLRVTDWMGPGGRWNLGEPGEELLRD